VITGYHLSTGHAGGGAPWEAMPELYRGRLLTVIPSRCGRGDVVIGAGEHVMWNFRGVHGCGGLPDLPVHARQGGRG